jgi:type I restriction enzyme S subunit
MKAKDKTPKDDRWKAKYKEPVTPDTSDLPEPPEGWCWAPLVGLTALIVDGTHHTPTYVSEGVAFISVKDVRGSTIHFEDCKFITMAEHSELIRRCRPERGDLLVTKSGTIGRTAVVRTDTPFSLFVSVALLKPASHEIASEWLEAGFLRWLQGKNVSQDVKGSAMKNLHLEDFRSMVFPLPPIVEQKRILEELERLNTICQHCERNLARSRSRVERARQSILKWAFEGRLVDQDPTDEPASALLERIRAERASIDSKKPKRPARRTPSTPKA